MSALPLQDAVDVEAYGAKAVGLGAALRAGLPVPPGLGLAASLVERLASGDEDAWRAVAPALAELASAPTAVRSSGIGEDSSGASFAGMHETVLGVVGEAAARAALARVWSSATSESALRYRAKLGIEGAPKLGVVIQRCVAADVAGVMFTRCPVSGDDVRVIEASWGLGESVVAGLVAPDAFRLERGGRVLERSPGEKPTAIRLQPDGDTATVEVADADVHRLCLDDAQLAALDALATRCDEAFGSPLHDIEWAFASDRLYLLQRRPITR